jgi:signal transduction histidine kinase
MEPTADGLVEIVSDIEPGAPVVDEEIAALGPNGHAPNGTVTLDGEDFDLHQMLHALQAVRVGDFSVRLPGKRTGLSGKIADTFNEIVAANQRMAQQLEHVGQVVGREGKTCRRVQFALASGAWGEMESSVNTLIDDLLWPTTAVTQAITAVARGDLLQTVRLDVDGRPLRGQFLRLATIVNTMIEQLGVFSSEVTHIAREVGTDGKLGGQAQVREVTGVWRDLVRGYAAGAVDYVPVPIIPDLSRAKVRVFAELYRKTRQLEARNAELERRVAERTAELAQANAGLELRVEERTREREAAVAQVHEMQKVESLGQLTGGVAHDFNNLLMAVLGNLDLLRKYIPDDPRTRRLIDGAIQGAERGAILTKRMLAFARRQELKPETVNVPALVDSMVEMLRRSLGPGTRIATDFAADVPATRVDPNQLEVALLNLALNARDAMPLGGQLTIAAHRERVAAGEVSGLQPGEYVCIVERDTGHGMDEATLKRATEPFFTTKGAGRGTGLGLSMVDGLVAQSGGAMRITSQLGIGTTVELWLPVSGVDDDAPTPPTRPQRAPPLREVRSCRVLVVDDDPIVATGTVAMLEDLGHVATEVPSGDAALQLLGSDTVIDLVITDHAMPGMTGTELAAHIRQSWPELPIVIASGYAELPGDEDLGLPRLSKPYRQHDLATLVARLIRDRPVVRRAAAGAAAQ